MNEGGLARAIPFEFIELHTTRGAEILRETTDVLFERATVIALRHHERWDGLGYPGKLRGDECPLDARIVAAADAYDRLVRLGSNHEAIVAYFSKEAGTRFDPKVAATVLEVLPLLRSVSDEDPKSSPAHRAT